MVTGDDGRQRFVHVRNLSISWFGGGDMFLCRCGFHHLPAEGDMEQTAVHHFRNVQAAIGHRQHRARKIQLSDDRFQRVIL